MRLFAGLSWKNLEFPNGGPYMRAMERASEPPAGVAFGRFQVLPHRRELLADGQPIKLGGRAFDVLMALIEARSEIVGKRALTARVWPDRVVMRIICHRRSRHCALLSAPSGI